MTACSFTDLAAIQRRRFRRDRIAQVGARGQKAANASPLNREVYDALEAEIAAINSDAKNEFGSAVEIRHALLNWIKSAEIVVIARTSAKHSIQLHYPVVAGAILFEKDGELEIADATSIEGLSDFTAVLRGDVAAILASAKFDAASAALPAAKPKFN